MTADTALQNWHTEYEYYTLDVDPLIHYRGSSPSTVGPPQFENEGLW